MGGVYLVFIYLIIYPPFFLTFLSLPLLPTFIFPTKPALTLSLILCFSCCATQENIANNKLDMPSSRVSNQLSCKDFIATLFCLSVFIYESVFNIPSLENLSNAQTKIISNSCLDESLSIC